MIDVYTKDLNRYITPGASIPSKGREIHCPESREGCAALISYNDEADTGCEKYLDFTEDPSVVRTLVQNLIDRADSNTTVFTPVCMGWEREFSYLQRPPAEVIALDIDLRQTLFAISRYTEDELSIPTHYHIGDYNQTDLLDLRSDIAAANTVIFNSNIVDHAIFQGKFDQWVRTTASNLTSLLETSDSVSLVFSSEEGQSKLLSIVEMIRGELPEHVEVEVMYNEDFGLENASQDEDDAYWIGDYAVLRLTQD